MKAPTRVLIQRTATPKSITRQPPKPTNSPHRLLLAKAKQNPKALHHLKTPPTTPSSTTPCPKQATATIPTLPRRSGSTHPRCCIFRTNTRMTAGARSACVRLSRTTSCASCGRITCVIRSRRKKSSRGSPKKSGSTSVLSRSGFRTRGLGIDGRVGLSLLVTLPSPLSGGRATGFQLLQGIYKFS